MKERDWDLLKVLFYRLLEEIIEKKTKTSVRIVRVSRKIWNLYIPNTSLEFYH
jgi:hypothetical protein